jgi:hydroxyacylglutathione hydrolase
MPSEVNRINLGGVNCYLLRSPKGYVLIDTGFSTKRTVLERELGKAGCKPGNLKLILLTHGDMDHAGNCAYLHEKYVAPTAIHSKDSAMVKQGEMGINRKTKPDKVSLIFKILMVFAKRLAEKHPFEKFMPDFEIDESFDLTAYGLDAKVLHIPGHSKGSIGVLTSSGDLFCGDMFYNIPGFGLVDDLIDHEKSMKRLASLRIAKVYPGHGRPFPIGDVIKSKVH